MGYLIYLFFVVFVWFCALAVLVMWAMLWVLMFFVSCIYVAFREGRKPKRLPPPRIVRQSFWSDRS